MSNDIYEVKQGKVYSPKGLPHLPRRFCDDLISVENDKYGITEIGYFNPKTKGNEIVFFADMWGGMIFYINDKGRKYFLDLYEVEMMPYGFIGKWKYENYLFEFEQRIVNNSVIISVKPIDKYEKDLELSLEFYDSFSLVPNVGGNYLTEYRGKRRTWTDWSYDGEALYTSYSEDGNETHAAIASNTQIQYIKRTTGNSKNILNFSGMSEKKIVVAIAFDFSKENVKKRFRKDIEETDELIEIQNERYESVMKKAPVLQSPYKHLNDFIALAPVYHESVKVLAHPGAIRAKTNQYWVWGWDGMSSPFSYNYWGDFDYISKLLNFYMKTADPERGIVHAYERDMTPGEVSMVSAQGFYINLLYVYYINGGDVKPFYTFAKRIFHMISEKERGDTGLFEGSSLFPDYRDAIDETGRDLSAFNNSSVYCAVRAMETLAQKMGDEETYRQAVELANRTKAHFSEVLFDEKKGYFAASADAVTLKRRDVYTSMAIKWDNLFCNELLEKKYAPQILKFFEENFVCKSGLLPIPVWGQGYDRDANQLHCFWPANSEYYARLINFENRSDLIEQFIGWISEWTELLMCPEGINCYAQGDEPYIDKWNSVSGAWQTYSIRAWYEAVIHNVVGVDFDDDGINFYPYSGKEMSILGLHYKNKTVDVYMKGSGKIIEKIDLNGQVLENIGKVSADLLKENNTVTVYRKEVT